MKKHIVCFGDSNTHGYCAVDFAHLTRQGHDRLAGTLLPIVKELLD